jgi:hypothetical protein
MIVLRLYGHLIVPLNESVTDKQFIAIDICNETANLLANKFNGKASCSSSGIMQYNDTVTFDNLKDSILDVILTAYPFIRSANSYNNYAETEYLRNYLSKI